MKIVSFLLGMGFLILALAVYLATWFIVFPLLLPEGRYPVLLAAIPALPLVWPAWIFFRKAGIKKGILPLGGQFFRLEVIAFVIFFVVFAFLVWLGVFD
jgi:hypothetical protein